MTEDEDPLVASALEAFGPAQLAAVQRLGTAEQLHQFALSYNVNDNPLIALAAAQHPACDRGTALLLFWQFADLVLYPEQTRRSGNWIEAARTAVAGIESLLRTGVFQSSDCFFDARRVLGLNAHQERRLNALGLPPELLSCGRLQSQPAKSA